MVIQFDHKYTIHHEELNWQEVEFIMIFQCGNILAPDSTARVNFSQCFMCTRHHNTFLDLFYPDRLPVKKVSHAIPTGS